MKRFTNKHIQKAYKQKQLIVGIGGVLLLCSVLFLVWGIAVIASMKSNVGDFAKISYAKKTIEDKKATFDITNAPYKFAVYEDSIASYYIVTDDEKLYIIYLANADYKKMNNKNLIASPVEITGITRVLGDNVRKLAIEAYNSEFNHEEDITIEKFEDVFGKVYLNTVVSENSIATTQFCLAALCFMFGFLVLFIGITEIRCFNKNIDRLNGISPEDLDKELNDEKTIFFDKLKLFVTPKYIVNFTGYMRIISYDDVLWMYKFEQKTDNISAGQCIKVATSDGKIYPIAGISLNVKDGEEEFQKAWDFISDKCSKALIGYTKENLEIMKSKVQDLKEVDLKKKKGKKSSDYAEVPVIIGNIEEDNNEGESK